MLFKKNEEKAAFKQEIKAKKAELADYRKLHRNWIKDFMKETDPFYAEVMMTVINIQAKRIAEKEVILTLMEKHYKLIKKL